LQSTGMPTPFLAEYPVLNGQLTQMGKIEFFPWHMPTRNNSNN
jgi:hypothetical protein